MLMAMVILTCGNTYIINGYMSNDLKICLTGMMNVEGKIRDCTPL